MPAIRSLLQKAMQERAPKAYRQLTQAGQLEATLDRLVAGHEQSLDDAMGAAMDSLSRQDSPQFQPDPMMRAQQFATRKLAAQETALNQAIEEIDSLSATTATSPAS